MITHVLWKKKEIFQREILSRPVNNKTKMRTNDHNESQNGAEISVEVERPKLMWDNDSWDKNKNRFKNE